MDTSPLAAESAFERRNNLCTQILALWRRIPLFWKFQLFGCAAFFLLSLPFKYLAYFQNWPDTLLHSALREPVAFAITLALRVCYRHPWVSQNGRRLGLAVLGLSALAAALDTACSYFLHHLLQAGLKPHGMHIMMASSLVTRFGLFSGWSALYTGIRAHYQNHARQLDLAEAESRRRRAELLMLRSQIDPHFLFNALNTILAESARDARTVQALTQHLATYLRYSLRHRESGQVALGEEFDAMCHYLEVERIRYGSSLEADSLIDPAARDFPVPGIVLQPLVENALRHGRETSAEPLRIRMSATRPEPNRVLLEVTNSGSWIDANPHRADGTGGAGLSNLRRRLELSHPGCHTLSVYDDGGWVRIGVEIRLPEEKS